MLPLATPPLPQSPLLFSSRPVAVYDLPWVPGGLLLERGRYLSPWGPSVSASASGALATEVLKFPKVTGIVGVMGVAETLGSGAPVWF